MKTYEKELQEYRVKMDLFMKGEVPPPPPKVPEPRCQISPESFFTKLPDRKSLDTDSDW